MPHAARRALQEGTPRQLRLSPLFSRVGHPCHFHGQPWPSLSNVPCPPVSSLCQTYKTKTPAAKNLTKSMQEKGQWGWEIKSTRMCVCLRILSKTETRRDRARKEGRQRKERPRQEQTRKGSKQACWSSQNLPKQASLFGQMRQSLSL